MVDSITITCLLHYTLSQHTNYNDVYVNDISHDREPHLNIGVAALHHHAHNSCIVTHDLY